MKIRYTLATTLLLLSHLVYGQQEEQYTQFMYNKVAFNPAAAGSEESAVLTAVARNQWLGIDGAPQSQLLTFNMPLFGERVGVGGNLLRQTIGLNETFELNGIYGYRIDFGRGTLAVALQGSVRLIRTDFTRAQAVQPVESDAAIPPAIESKYVPNFGAGLYYHDGDERFYMGIAIPRFLENNIDLADSEDILTREIRHFYAMGGLRISLASEDELVLTPQVLLKYVQGAPFDADVNFMFTLRDKFNLGFSYRIGGSKSSSVGESVSMILGLDLSDHFMFSISYDATLSELRRYTSGTVEGLLSYRFAGKSKGDKKETINGRDFYDD